MTFQEHGYHKTKILGHMIVSRLSGSLNEESSNAYIDEVDSARSSFVNKPYTLLIDLKNLEGGTIEAWQKANEHNFVLLEDKMFIGKAIIVNSTTNEYFAKKINSMLPNDKVKTFEDRKAAKAWLESKVNSIL